MSVSQAFRNPRSYFGRQLRLYRTLLFDPETFYEEYVKHPGIGREAALVAVIGLVGTAGAYYAVEQLIAGFATGLAEVGPELGDTTSLILWQRAVNPLVGAYLLWVGFTGVTYGISWLYSSRGGFFRLLKNTAWALVPVLIANLLNTVAWAATAYLNADRYAQEIPSEVESRSMFPGETAAFVWDYVASEPLVMATTLLSVVFVAWSGYILAHGLARMRDLEMRRAYGIVAVPVLGYAVWLAGTMLGVF